MSLRTADRLFFGRAVVSLLGQASVDHLRRFAYRLAESKADIYVFVARKAVCLLDLFTLLGWPLPKGRLVSDRVLPLMPSEELRGKHVVIVDDIVIVGSAIAKIRAHLENCGATVEACVAAVNVDWVVKDLFSPSGHELHLKDAQSAEFCSSLVDVIMMMCRPYEVDFPLLRFGMPESGLGSPPLALQEAPFKGCRFQEITTSFHRRFEQQRFVVHVTHPRISGLLSQLGCERLIEQAPITKIRLYHSRILRTLVVMPIVTFEQLSKADLEFAIPRLIRSLPSERIGCVLENLLAKPILGHRVLTYLISYVLAAAFLQKWSDGGQSPISIHPKGLESHVEDKDVEICLGNIGSPLLRHVIRALANGLIWPAGEDVESDRVSPPESLSPIGHRVEVFSGERLYGDAQDGYLATDVASRFLVMHRKVEIPARRILAADPKDTEALDRFNGGLTCRDLVCLLGRDGWDFRDTRVKQQLSQIIDYYVDRGAIVPGIQADASGTTYRSYRPGEELHFLDKHFKVVCSALRQAFRLREVWDDEAIRGFPHLHIEKLLVVLLKHMWGLKLCHVQGLERDGYLVNVLFRRMGATAEMDKIGRHQPTAMREYLERKGYLTGTDVNWDPITEDFPDAIPVDETSQAAINSLALLWTREVLAVGDGRKRRAIVMSSCTNDYDALQAMFTDVDLCQDELRSVKPLESIADMPWPKQLEALREWASAVGGNRKVEADNFFLKLKAWRSNEAAAMIAAVEARLAANKEYDRAELWHAAWQAMIPQHPLPDGLVEQAVAAVVPLGVALMHVVVVCGECATYALGGAKPDDVGLATELRQYVAQCPECDKLFDTFMERAVTVLSAPRGKAAVAAAQLLSKAACALFRAACSLWRSRSGMTVRDLESLQAETYRYRRQFSADYLVWYDVKDSRGRRATDGPEYVKRVQQFTQDCNAFLREQFEYWGGRYCVYHGTSRDENDEKHLFCADAEAVSHFVTDLQRLADRAHIHLRMLVCACTEIDSQLRVVAVENGLEAEARGGFFPWLAGFKEDLKTKESPEPEHSIAWQHEWHAGRAPVFPNKPFDIVTARAERAGDVRDRQFRQYKSVT